jgi:glycosyltransferase involved in cell wall biosynthesis
MLTYWRAHSLAQRGHDVNVVTNAKEAGPPYRMHMRSEDWKRCEAEYGPGSVRVHWTDPVDRSQSYVPMASSFVTKLATTAARVHSQRPFDVIYSHYLEPYGVAGHLAAQMTGVPHVARMAGSDSGRLWHHPQFELLYDHVLRSAEAVIAVGTVAERAIEHGVAPDRIATGDAFVVPEHLFTSEGPALDLAPLQSEIAQDRDLAGLVWGEFAADRPYFGVYGKLGERKGSFALLAAMHRLKQAGVEVGLVALAHGQPSVQKRFRAQASELGLVDRILQIPFLPHWRVPEFLRGCLAVCCLEQDFPIAVHAPIIPREVLMSGTCLVGATEVIRKLPSFEQLPHGYGCVAIEDVNDTALLSERLAAIVNDPGTAAAIGARGRAFALEVQRGVPFPQRLERILESAAARQRAPSTTRQSAAAAAAELEHSFPLTHLVAAAVADIGGNGLHEVKPASPGRAADLTWARQVLDTVEQGMLGGATSLRPLAQAVQIEIAVATAEDEADRAGPMAKRDPLFRLRLAQWAMKEGTLAELVPVRDPQLRIVEFDFDASQFLGAQTIAAFPAIAAPRRSFIAAFGNSDDGRRAPLLVDELTARILRLSDGTLTTSEILTELRLEDRTAAVDDTVAWIENLFRLALVALQDARVVESVDCSPRRDAVTEFRA